MEAELLAHPETPFPVGVEQLPSPDAEVGRVGRRFGVHQGERVAGRAKFQLLELDGATARCLRVE